LRAVEAPFFAVLDDDDTVMPTHFPDLLRLARDAPSHCLYYSGGIRIQEEPNDYVRVFPSGPLEIDIQERRELMFLDRFSLTRLLQLDNYIQSNAWIASTSCLDSRLLIDPEMVVAEDMYLYLILLQNGPFKLNPNPTAYWHWRSTNRENSMLNVMDETWSYEANRMLTKLNQEVLPNGITLGDMRHILDAAPIKGKPTVQPYPMRLMKGQSITLSEQYVAGTRQHNLHGVEPSGVWTSAEYANLQLRLESPASQILVRIEFDAVHAPAQGFQYVQLSINGQEIFSGHITNEHPQIAIGRIHLFPASTSLTLSACCKYTVVPQDAGHSNDARSLGVFLKNIRYEVEVEDFNTEETGESHEFP
jgi:phosphoglycerol transferase